jgi:hypothetical protein
VRTSDAPWVQRNATLEPISGEETRKWSGCSCREACEPAPLVGPMLQEGIPGASCLLGSLKGGVTLGSLCTNGTHPDPMPRHPKSVTLRCFYDFPKRRNFLITRRSGVRIPPPLPRNEAPGVLTTPGALLSLRRVSGPRGDERLRRRERRRIGDPSISPHLLFGQHPPTPPGPPGPHGPPGPPGSPSPFPPPLLMSDAQ